MTQAYRFMGPTLAAIAVLAAPFAAAAADYFPTGKTWETVTPAQARMDPAAVSEAMAYAGAHNSTGVVVLRGGKIVAEQYWQGWDAQKSGIIYSASKSLTATLVGMAIQDGYIKSVDQSVADFIPAWKGTPKEAITIRHLLTMTSGLKLVPATRPGAVEDIFRDAAGQPLEVSPGTRWTYHTPAYRMLAKILGIATGVTPEEYTARRLTGPLGMTGTSWQTSPTPTGGTNYYWLQATTRDMARFGLFAERHGNWSGKQLVPAAWFADMTRTSQDLNKAYGYLWWLNKEPPNNLKAVTKGGVMWPECPPDMIAALGAQDKKIYVVPSLDLVVVRHGGMAEPPGAGGTGMHGALDKQLMGRLCQAVRN